MAWENAESTEKKIDSSLTDKHTKNETKKALDDAKKILDLAYESKRQEIIDKFRGEYENLRKTIVMSLINDRKITQDELAKIRFELWNIKNLNEQENSWIGWKFRFRLKNFFSNDKDFSNFTNKNIESYSQKESIWALEFLNKKYRTYEWSDILDKALNFNNKSISELNSKREVRVFQEKLVKKILWNNKWYNLNYITGYDTIKGNYITKISTFESKIKSNEQIWWEITANYISYLNEIYPNKNDFIKNIRWKFWNRYWKIQDVLKIWESQQKNNALNILKKYWIIKEWNFVIDFFNWLFARFEKMSSSVNVFINSKNKLTPDEEQKYINFLKENRDILKTQFKNDLLKKFSWIENKEKIVTEIINELLLAKKLWEMYVIIWNYENHYKRKLDKEETIWSFFKYKIEELKIKYKELIRKKSKTKNKTEEKQVELEIKKVWEQIKKHETHIIVNTFTTEKEKEEIIKRTKKWENEEKIFKYIRSKNKTLDKKITETETKWKNEYKTISNKTTSNKTNNENVKKDKNNLIQKKWKDIEKNKQAYKPDITPTENWKFLIKTKRWNELIITWREKDLIEKNPKVERNLIRFNRFFEKLNLKSIWDYREEITKSIWATNINLEDNWLTNAELLNFWNKILKFINKIPREKWEKKELFNEDNKNLKSLKFELWKYSWKNMSWWQKSYWISWTDRFEYDLKRLKIIWDWSQPFKTYAFSNIINQKK